jgi:hypothetical protein
VRNIGDRASAVVDLARARSTTSQFTRKDSEKPMKYLCLVYSDEARLHSGPDSPEDRECHEYDQELGKNGHRIAAEALESVQTATTVRVRNGNVSITDGPFAETKEQLAGFYLVESRDLNEAIQLASKIPAARVGSIEVRPVRQLDI